jgi:hypothetical protein
VFVTTTYGGKLNVPAILKIAEQFGPVKLNNFRDKQSFGFIQFDSQEVRSLLDLPPRRVNERSLIIRH